MRISPLDIRQQQFTVKWVRGFDIHEVDAFLDDVAEDYETVLKENAQLKEQVATFEERARGLGERERALQDTLVTTHRLGDEMKATARREDHRGGARRRGADPGRDPDAAACPPAAHRGLPRDARELLPHDVRRVWRGQGRRQELRAPGCPSASSRGPRVTRSSAGRMPP